MSMLETVKLWNKGVELLEGGQVREALSTFCEVRDPSSRILFNIGTCHFRLQQHQQALQLLSSAIQKDDHLAVAYLLRGITYYRINSFSEALSDFKSCLQKLRGKHVVDYGQLGMRYKLFACEPLYNIGVVYARTGDHSQALHYMTEAVERPTELRHAVLNEGLNALRKQKLAEVTPWVLPPDSIFKPPRSKVVNIDKKDYLGKAKVISSTEMQRQPSKTVSKPEKDLSRRKPSVPSLPPHRLLRLPEGHPKSRSLDDLDCQGRSQGHDSAGRFISGSISPQSNRREQSHSQSAAGTAEIVGNKNGKVGPHSSQRASKAIASRPAPPPPLPKKPASQTSINEMSNSSVQGPENHSQALPPTLQPYKPVVPNKPAVFFHGQPLAAIQFQQRYSLPGGNTEAGQAVASSKLNRVPTVPLKPTGMQSFRTPYSGAKNRRTFSTGQNIPPPPERPLPPAPVRTVP